MENMKVASMFAGIGGICLAFKRAGYTVVWANERDARACNTYRKNFGGEYLCEGDVTKVDTDSIPDMDILVAGFPCQPFSIAGMQKGFQDRRGNMFFEIIKVAKDKKPRVIFLENVANLKWHDGGNTFSIIIHTLEELGYFVKYKILAANEYANLPQTRRRIFIVAFKSKKEYIEFEFPRPIKRTVGINDIIDRSVKHHAIYYYSGRMEEELLKQITDRNSIYQIMDHGIRKVKNNMCPTLTANMGTFPNRVPVICDDYGIRKLTLRECLDFQGFPQDFKFPNNISIHDAYKQIGNSVVVPVVERIVEEIEFYD